MHVTVQREPAPGHQPKQGPNVTSDLLTDPITAREKGAQMIDRNWSGRTKEQITGPYREFVETGLLAEVTEESEQWKGKTIYWSRTLTLEGEVFTMDMTTHVERQRANE